MSAAQPEAGAKQADIADALYDSAYLAGVQRGWSLGQFDNKAGFAAVFKSREGYLKPIHAAQPEADQLKVAAPTEPTPKG